MCQEPETTQQSQEEIISSRMAAFDEALLPEGARRRSLIGVIYGFISGTKTATHRPPRPKKEKDPRMAAFDELTDPTIHLRKK